MYPGKHAKLRPDRPAVIMAGSGVCNGHERSPRLDDREGSIAVIRGGSPDVGNCTKETIAAGGLVGLPG